MIKDDSCLLSVSNDGGTCSVRRNISHNERENESASEFSHLSAVDSESFVNSNMIWSDFIVSVDNDGSIEYERMSFEGGTAEV